MSGRLSFLTESDGQRRAGRIVLLVRVVTLLVTSPISIDQNMSLSEAYGILLIEILKLNFFIQLLTKRFVESHRNLNQCHTSVFVNVCF